MFCYPPSFFVCLLGMKEQEKRADGLSDFLFPVEMDDTDEELWFSSLAANDRHTYEAEKAFVRFRKRIFASKRQRKSFRLLRRLGYAAAAAILLGVVSVVSYWQGRQRFEKNLTDMVVEAPLGSKTKLQLPDGSTVWLNAGSRLIYSQSFGMKSRTLTLRGEAFFEVKTNKNLPFCVRTSDLNVTVLGTKFNFRNYEEDREVMVELEEGCVALDNRVKKTDLRYLSPSEKMTLNKLTGEMRISLSEPQKAKGWMDGVLFFDEELFPDIVRELERSYHVNIRIADPKLWNERFYGSFNREEQNVYQVLDMLSGTQRLKYKTENDTLVVYK